MYSKDLVLRAINLYNRFKNYRYVGSLLNIGKSTIHRWVNNIHYRIDKTCIPINDIMASIKNLLDKNKFITIKKIKDRIYKQYNHNFSMSFIYTIIVRKLKYSYKKVTHKLYNKSVLQLKKLQQKFMNKIQNINFNNIICIDESYFYSNTTSDYGWCKKGLRLTSYIKSNPTKYSLLLAITNKNIIHYEIHTTNINSTIFKHFITILTNRFKNYYFLMDNVSFHKSKDIMHTIINSNNHLLFIPPYSPEYNPIEEVFSFIKNKLKRSQLKNKQKYIKSILKRIKRSHLTNYYKHSFINKQ